MKKYISIFISTILFFAISSNVSAANTVVWNQGFETDTSGWFDNTDYPNYGEIIRVPSGTNSVTSADGSFHANIVEKYPYSRFDGYKSVWPGTWIAEIDVYLDTNWSLGSGFDYSVAATGTDNAHQRDFVFHVTKDTSTGNLLIAGSNNTNFNPREDLENISNHYVIANSGWYTLRHTFKNVAGVLAVDLQLVDSNNNVLWTETRTNAQDTIPDQVGGNRYAWFTAMSAGLNLAIDNHKLTIITRSAEITSPTTDVYPGLVNFSAYLDDDDVDAIQWAVRKGTCAANTGTVFGNVDEHNDVATIVTSNLSNQTFSFTGDMSTMETGMYCFVYNPVEDGGESDIRLTKEFNLLEPLTTPTDMNQCKKGGWMTFNNPTFKNQGSCVSYVQSNEKANKRD